MQRQKNQKSSDKKSPIIIIGVRHFEQCGKEALQAALPDLAELKYDTLCAEFPPDSAEEDVFKLMQSTHEGCQKICADVIEHLARAGIVQGKSYQNLEDIPYTTLANLIKLYYSSQSFAYFAKIIKNRHNALATLDLFKHAKRCSMMIKGIDVPSRESVPTDLGEAPEKDKKLIENYKERDKVFFYWLNELYETTQGIIVFVGAVHLAGLSAKLTQQSIPHTTYLLHSSVVYDNINDDIDTDLAHIIALGAVAAKDHTFSINNSEDIMLFKEKLIGEILQTASLAQTEKIHIEKEIDKSVTPSIYDASSTLFSYKSSKLNSDQLYKQAVEAYRDHDYMQAKDKFAQALFLTVERSTPLVEIAKHHAALAAVHREQGEIDQALPHAKLAVNFRRTALGANDPLTTRAMDKLQELIELNLSKNVSGLQN